MQRSTTTNWTASLLPAAMRQYPVLSDDDGTGGASALRLFVACEFQHLQHKTGTVQLGVPILSVAAPIIGALAGAWIGAIAGIDESDRVGQVPNQNNYRRMLSEGKSFVVITGDEATRIEYGKRMTELGASEVHQHSPEQHLFWGE